MSTILGGFLSVKDALAASEKMYEAEVLEKKCPTPKDKRVTQHCAIVVQHTDTKEFGLEIDSGDDKYLDTADQSKVVAKTSPWKMVDPGLVAEARMVATEKELDLRG